MNPPIKSKINATSLVLALVGVAVSMGLIPEAIKEQVTEIALIARPVLIATLRTWFTEAK